jgi:hypothetical protein
VRARALVGAVLLAATAAAAPGCGERAAVSPVAGGASGGATVAAKATAAPCAGCHAAIAEEWRVSFHRTAFSDATFQESLALEEPGERAFCTRCHAPAATARRDGTAAGVDCVACHAEAHAGASAGAGAGARASACGKCHEFAFDDGRDDLVQKTVSEHAASIYAGVGCAECHMPARDGHMDHRFVSGHAPAQIARAVHVEVRRERDARSGKDGVRIAIRVDAGHAFPTGDMFRRARLLVFGEGARGEIVADAERTFGRTWGSVRGGEHAGRREQRSDTRIRGTWAEVVELEAPSSPIVRVHWILLYERVVAMRGAHVDLASSDTIAEGELAW